MSGASDLATRNGKGIGCEMTRSLECRGQTILIHGDGEKEDESTGPTSGDGGDGEPLLGDPLEANEASRFWKADRKRRNLFRLYLNI